mgnify:CR=1 FL=1|jgi:L-cysteine S-thiosulfotransferase
MNWRALCFALIATLPSAATSTEILPSGTTFLSQGLQAQAADAGANPGMLWVADGERLWNTAESAASSSCASCHGDAEVSMRGVATRYPLVIPGSNQLLNLEGRINTCRVQRQNALAYAHESDELLSLSAFVARQSLHMPLKVTVNDANAEFFAAGEAAFHQRRGQLNLSCANCHVERVGLRLRGDVITHALPNAFPIYRLEWQGLGSLHRRLRACALGVRAEMFDYGSEAYLNLELYLTVRANGVAVETPGIRK